MGRFQDNIKESWEKFWDTLSREDVKGTKECTFEGDLAVGLKSVKEQEKLQDSLTNSLHHTSHKEEKLNINVNSSNNIMIQSSKNEIQKTRNINQENVGKELNEGNIIEK